MTKELIKALKCYNKLTEEDQNTFRQALNIRNVELSKLDELSYRISVGEQLNSFTNVDGKPFFNPSWIAKYIMKFTDDEINQNGQPTPEQLTPTKKESK